MKRIGWTYGFALTIATLLLVVFDDVGLGGRAIGAFCLGFGLCGLGYLIGTAAETRR